VYRATVSIRNNGQAPSPKFIVNFYLGDPENVEPMTHGAGPIKPGEVWNEWSGPFGLNEGINEITVVLDPANLVDEPDEQNNSAVMEVTIKDGQIVEKSVFYSTERSEPSPGM
jgi:subtilase family serine protease